MTELSMATKSALIFYGSSSRVDKKPKKHAGAFPTQLTKAKYRCADAPLAAAKCAKFQTGERCVVTAALGNYLVICEESIGALGLIMITRKAAHQTDDQPCGHALGDGRR
jgi:hypothetical protein